MSDVALDLLAALRLEDGRRWGEAAVDVQWEDARAVLAEISPTPYHWLGRARGYSKTTDLGAIALVAMLAQAPERARLFGLAADQAQGTLLVDAIGGFCHRTPELRNAVQVQDTKVVATRSGATLTILPADSASIWGLRPWLAVVDELSAWHDSARTRRVWEGLTTALAKVPGSRLAVICTAGDPAHWSKAVLDHAYGDDLWRDMSQSPAWFPGRLRAGMRRLDQHEDTGCVILRGRRRGSATTLPTEEENVDPGNGEDRGFRPLLEYLLNQGRREAKAGSKGSHVFRDPNEDDRVWVVFDWDEEGWQNFVSDPEVPAIFQEGGLQGRPKAAELGGEADT